MQVVACYPTIDLEAVRADLGVASSHHTPTQDWTFIPIPAQEKWGGS